MPTNTPSAKLRNEYNAVSEECHATGRPIFVTGYGNDDLAIMSMGASERLASDAVSELLTLLAQGHADVEAKRSRPATDVIADLRARLLV